MRTQQEEDPGALGGDRSGTSFQEDLLEVAALMEKKGLKPGWSELQWLLPWL